MSLSGAPPLDGAGSECFSADSPRRPVEARRRCGADGNGVLEERSEECFRAPPSRTVVYEEANPATQKVHHVVSRKQFCGRCRVVRPLIRRDLLYVP